MRGRLISRLVLLFLWSSACQPKPEFHDEQSFRLGLAEDYRFRESIVAGIPFMKEDTSLSFLKEGDIVLRFNSAQCLDCLKPIFDFLQSLSPIESQYIHLLGTFDSELQFKSYLKKQQVEHLKHFNIPPNSLSSFLEDLPGPYLFMISTQNTASRTFILDKYFQELNLRYLRALINESLTANIISKEVKP